MSEPPADRPSKDKMLWGAVVAVATVVGVVAGIGLTLVRTIAELHGGTISVVSEGEGQGSEFTLTLPVIVSPPTTSITRDKDPSRASKCRVLVVDDAKATADTLALFFELEGLQTSVANDGEQAVEVAARDKPEIGCLDIGLPGMDGNEAARRIRSLLPDIFLVSITGWGTKEDRTKTTNAGFDHHLVKPVKMDELRDLLQSHAKHCFPC